MPTYSQIVSSFKHSFIGDKKKRACRASFGIVVKAHLEMPASHRAVPASSALTLFLMLAAYFCAPWGTAGDAWGPAPM